MSDFKKVLAINKRGASKLMVKWENVVRSPGGGYSIERRASRPPMTDAPKSISADGFTIRFSPRPDGFEGVILSREFKPGDRGPISFAFVTRFNTSTKSPYGRVLHVAQQLEELGEDTAAQYFFTLVDGWIRRMIALMDLAWGKPWEIIESEMRVTW